MEAKEYRIYLDICCLNRPFDDLSSIRVRLEADAVLTVLTKCDNREWSLVTSDIIVREMDKQTDVQKLQKVQALLAVANKKLKITSDAVKRAEEFQQKGIKVFDSYHLAVAEENDCDVFLTTDDRFLKRAKEIALNIVVENPAKWIVEVI